MYIRDATFGFYYVNTRSDLYNIFFRLYNNVFRERFIYIQPLDKNLFTRTYFGLSSINVSRLYNSGL